MQLFALFSVFVRPHSKSARPFFLFDHVKCEWTLKITSGETSKNDVISLVDVDECSSVPCLNGATCTSGIDSYACQCSQDYIKNKIMKGPQCALRSL